jgi:hypothetical protein
MEACAWVRLGVRGEHMCVGCEAGWVCACCVCVRVGVLSWPIRKIDADLLQ